MKTRVLLCALILALFTTAGLSPASVAEAKKPSWPRTLTITYCWGASTVDPQCPQQDVILYKDKTLFVQAPEGSDTGAWTYHKPTKTLTLTFDSYSTVFTGVRQGKWCYNGTMEFEGLTGAWSGCIS